MSGLPPPSRPSPRTPEKYLPEFPHKTGMSIPHRPPNSPNPSNHAPFPPKNSWHTSYGPLGIIRSVTNQEPGNTPGSFSCSTRFHLSRLERILCIQSTTHPQHRRQLHSGPTRQTLEWSLRSVSTLYIQTNNPRKISSLDIYPGGGVYPSSVQRRLELLQRPSTRFPILISSHSIHHPTRYPVLTP
jgi:hypothetical protein